MTENVNNKTTGGDIAHSLTKAGLGAIPVVGSLASEIFGLVVTPPLEKRRAEWMNEVAERLQALENNHSIDLDKLKDNEQLLLYNENKVVANKAELIMASRFGGDIEQLSFRNKLTRFENLTMLNSRVKEVKSNQ